MTLDASMPIEQVAATASQEVDLDAVRRWSVTERHAGHYGEFLRAVPRDG